MRTAAILPVKRFDIAKQRLGATVTEPLRRDLTRAMVADVLAALNAVAGLELRIVVTSEPSVADAAGRRGAVVIADERELGQNAAAALGLEHALAAGMERALLVPGDCPALDPEEVERLLDPAAGSAEVVIVPDRHGTGTNALLLTPVDVVVPSFGPGSFARHRALAQDAGAACRVRRPASLLLDIDTGADLRALRERLAGERLLAASTRAVLADQVGERIATGS